MSEGISSREGREVLEEDNFGFSHFYAQHGTQTQDPDQESHALHIE